MDLLSDLALGWSVAISPQTLMFCFLGVLLGTVVGVLPGIGALASISLLLPVTYHIDPTSAIVMLAGVYYGSAYGGSTAAILLNLPGTPNSAVSCLDGYPMSRQGRAGVALFMTAIASFVGALAGLIVLILFSPAIAELGFRFGAPEYFALMVLGLVAASTITSGSPVKGLAMVVFGLILGTVGIDVNSGIARFNFGVLELMDGLSLIALAMGLFGISEVISSINNVPMRTNANARVTLRSLIPTREDWRRSCLPMLRGSGIGGFVGALPGVGSTIASFMAYAVEKRVSKDPAKFGKGAIEGLTAPESANNASIQTAFVPSLSLGIPGDVVMALMLAALIIHGITPGPTLMVNQPGLFWGLIVSFLVGNIMLLALNIPLVGLWVRLLSIPYRVLFPAILVFICLGAFSESNNTFDIMMLFIFGAVGYLMILLRFEPAPVLLGFVLGPLMEEHLRRSLILSRGDVTVFFNRPISGTLLVVTALMIVWAFWAWWRRSSGTPKESAEQV